MRRASRSATRSTGGTTVNVTLRKGIFLIEQRVGNIMAGFSSRGPYPVVPDWIKPDVTAPGVQNPRRPHA